MLYHLSKTNATYVNKASVMEHVLLDGEMIQMGHTQLKFRVEVEEEEDFGPAGDWSDYEDKELWVADSQSSWEPDSQPAESWVPC